MTRYDVDLFVIGGGSGGVRAARVAAEHGARVAIAEESRWGGTCVIRGCVPKKLFVYASEFSRSFEDARGFGWTIDGAHFDWPSLIAAKDKEISRLSAAYAERLRKAGVALHETRAQLVDAHTLALDDKHVTAANIVIATGGRAKVPSGGAKRWITSDDAFHLPSLPKELTILGGGYIAVEFAHIFAGLGVKIRLVNRGLLRGFDPDIIAEAEQGLVHHGIELVRGESVGDCELAMSAIGRKPNIGGLGLEGLGVAIDARGAITVDKWSRTNVPHIFAIGDVTGRVALTPVAIREGHALADTLFGNRSTPIDHHLIPTAVFAQPAIAAIGLTEPAAREGGHEVQVFRAKFRPMRHTLSGRDEKVLLKLVVDKQTDRVLGLHVAGIDAPEIVQAAAIAITMKATKADFDRTFALHPTTAEELVLLR